MYTCILTTCISCVLKGSCVFGSLCVSRFLSPRDIARLLSSRVSRHPRPTPTEIFIPRHRQSFFFLLFVFLPLEYRRWRHEGLQDKKAKKNLSPRLGWSPPKTLLHEKERYVASKDTRECSFLLSRRLYVKRKRRSRRTMLTMLMEILGWCSSSLSLF